MIKFLKENKEVTTVIELLLLIVTLLIFNYYKSALVETTLINDNIIFILKGVSYLTFLLMVISFFFKRYSIYYTWTMRATYSTFMLLMLVLLINKTHYTNIPKKYAEVVKIKKNNQGKIKEITILVEGVKKNVDMEDKLIICEIYPKKIISLELKKGFLGFEVINTTNCIKW